MCVSVWGEGVCMFERYTLSVEIRVSVLFTNTPTNDFKTIVVP